MYLTNGAILEVSESKTRLLIKNNKQIKKNVASSGGGGGLFASQVKTTVSLSSGSHTNITNNYAEVNGGGLYFEVDPAPVGAPVLHRNLLHHQQARARTHLK